MSALPSPGKILLDRARAYFPEPEFALDTVLPPATYSHILRVLHRPSRLSVFHTLDPDWCTHTDLVQAVIEGLASSMHEQLARDGHGTPFNHRDPPDNQDWGAIWALLQLMALELIWRDDVQGIAAPYGRKLYLVRRNEWALDISPRITMLPLQYWQGYVHSVLARPPTPGTKTL